MTELEALYRENFKPVYLFLRHLGADAALAEDITADTFFKAMEALDSFRGDCDKRVWLCQIAKHRYFDHLKKAGRTLPLEAAPPETAPSPEEQTVRSLAADQVRRQLHTLPEQYKEVFMWRVYGELSFREIGQLFGKSENWACVTYHRAKAMIKEKLDES